MSKDILQDIISHTLILGDFIFNSNLMFYCDSSHEKVDKNKINLHKMKSFRSLTYSYTQKTHTNWTTIHGMTERHEPKLTVSTSLGFIEDKVIVFVTIKAHNISLPYKISTNQLFTLACDFWLLSQTIQVTQALSRLKFQVLFQDSQGFQLFQFKSSENKMLNQWMSHQTKTLK